MEGRARQTGIRQGDRLPAASLPSATTGRPVPLREPAAGSVAILALPAEPERFADYARAFVLPRPGYHYWAGRPIVLIPGSPEAAARAAAALGLPGEDEDPSGGRRVLVDVDGALRRRWRIPAADAAVIIADRWGEVYAAMTGSDPGELPGPDAVDEWLRFLSTQCPECGVIDEPGPGEWAIG